MTNFKNKETVIVSVKNKNTKAVFHSFSRQRGFAYVTSPHNGKFKHVKIDDIKKCNA